LGGKIGLSALMLVGGFYYLAYAFRERHSVDHGANIGYSLLGYLGVLVGVALGSYAILGL
jgi:uncharacterized membrane protein HdeD (DUF308 family)